MRAQFDIERERSRELFKRVVNDNIDGQSPYTFHSQIELYFVDEGEVDVLIDGKKRTLTAGQMAVVLSYCPHLFRSVGGSVSSLLLIPPEICSELSSVIGSRQLSSPFICDADTVREIRKMLESAMAEGLNGVKLKGYLYLILGTVLDNIFLEGSDEAANTELSEKLLLYLNQNFKNDISSETLSAAFGYNKRYLSSYFKSTFGVGINQYLNVLRLKNALLLMKNGKNTHTFCALESGFSSMRTFYRVFKEELGCAPGDYFSDSLNK